MIKIIEILRIYDKLPVEEPLYGEDTIERHNKNKVMCHKDNKIRLQGTKLREKEVNFWSFVKGKKMFDSVFAMGDQV